ncbi:hypothetical protein RUM43_003329 [Polyplax serrata]|uniref:Uncharacterized protein n=1 Tax=Polyplax serrata TaxID=468196 RepID=A0AAN8S5H3_POLSC
MIQNGETSIITAGRREFVFKVKIFFRFVESEENEQASFSNLVVFQLRLPRKQIGMQVVRKNIQSESKDGNSICQVPPTFCPSNPKKRRWNPMICTLGRFLALLKMPLSHADM